MRETRPSGSEGGEAELNRPSLPLSRAPSQSPFCLPENLAAHGGTVVVQFGRNFRGVKEKANLALR